jgi:hypothetical protein
MSRDFPRHSNDKKKRSSKEDTDSNSSRQSSHELDAACYSHQGSRNVRTPLSSCVDDDERVLLRISVQMDQVNEKKYFHQLLNINNRTGNSHYSSS